MDARGPGRSGRAALAVLALAGVAWAAEPTVKRENGRVWVTGVPDIQMAGDFPRLVGMQILLKHRGEEATLDELMVHSGDAFNLCHATKWELRAGLSIPTDPLSNVARAYGYACRWTQPHWFFALKGKKPEERHSITDAFLKQLYAQVDAGRPCLLGGTHGQCARWRVVAGYDPTETRICYVGGKRPYEWTQLIDAKVAKLGFWDSQCRGTIRPGFYGGWLVNAALLLGKKVASPTPRDRAVATLRLALRIFRAPSFHTEGYGGVTYCFGRGAYDEWADALHELDYPADLTTRRPKKGDFYDMSNFAGQVAAIARGRAAAAGFCEKAATALPKAKAHLAAAARAYREEAGIARASFRPFLDGTEGERKQWLADETRREAGVAAIRRMLAAERAAIGAIERALGAVGAAVPRS